MFKQAFERIDMQHRALNAYWLKNSAIAQNIANVETPGYKRKDVNFDAILNQKINGMALKVTNPKHMQSMQAFEPYIMTDSMHSMRLDKNNVNIETEMAQQAKNAINYNTVISRVDAEFRKLQSAIKGGK